MYKVCFKEFFSFDDVIHYAWTEHKIELDDDPAAMTEEEKQEACHELDCMINDN